MSPAIFNSSSSNVDNTKASNIYVMAMYEHIHLIQIILFLSSDSRRKVIWIHLSTTIVILYNFLYWTNLSIFHQKCNLRYLSTKCKFSLGELNNHIGSSKNRKWRGLSYTFIDPKLFHLICAHFKIMANALFWSVHWKSNLVTYSFLCITQHSNGFHQQLLVLAVVYSIIIGTGVCSVYCRDYHSGVTLSNKTFIDWFGVNIGHPIKRTCAIEWQFFLPSKHANFVFGV